MQSTILRFDIKVMSVIVQLSDQKYSNLIHKTWIRDLIKSNECLTRNIILFVKQVTLFWLKSKPILLDWNLKNKYTTNVLSFDTLREIPISVHFWENLVLVYCFKYMRSLQKDPHSSCHSYYKKDDQ